MEDYTLTLFEACEFLNRSKKSLGRYIRQGRLHPRRVKSSKGTLEYRFSKDDLETFRQAETGQEEPTQDIPDETGQDETKDKPIQTTKQGKEKPKSEPIPEDKQEETIIEVLKDTTDLLKNQLEVKDTQIKEQAEQIKALNGTMDELIQRDRETNILLKGLQDKLVLLEAPKQGDDRPMTVVEVKEDKAGQDAPAKTGQEKNSQGKTSRAKKPKKKTTKPKTKKKQPKKERKAEADPKETGEKKGFFKRLFRN